MYVWQKGPADVGLLLHHCESTYSGTETILCRGELPELVRTERGNGIAAGNGEEGEEEEKEESTVSPECIDNTVAQFSLPPSPFHLLL